MPAFIIAAMLRIGVMPRYAKFAAWVSVVIAIIVALLLASLAFSAWVHKKETTAVKLDRAEVNAEVAKRTIEADRAAEAAKQERDTEDAKRAEELRNAAKQADTGGVGPGTAAVYRKLREQQAARRTGSAPAK